LAQKDQEKGSLRDAAPSPPSRRASTLRLGLFLGLALLSLLAMTALSRTLPVRGRARFDSSLLAQIKSVRPAFVLLGNSMVGTRFDEATLRSALRTRRVVVFGISASKSAEWYLVLKNMIVPSKQHPRLVLFYRDEELTQPRKHALGAAHASLERLSPEDDPIVEKKLAPSLAKPMARLAWYRDQVMPFQRFLAKTDPLPDAAAALFSRALWADATPRARRAQINDLFELSNLRPADAAQERAYQSPRFADVVDPSFLPDICGLAKEHEIPLTFVKVRTRDAASGVPETPSERRYIADMARYLRESCSAEYYDMHDEAWESIDLYGNGDHIAGRFKRAYTLSFVEHMGQIFH